MLHSSVHELWARGLGTQVREVESGFRYTPTTTFETFPLPDASDDARGDIAEAATALYTLRSGWLNPPGLLEAELRARTLTNLYNLSPSWLEQAHERLDRAVHAAYGWDYPLEREEVLARLVELNVGRARARAATGAWFASRRDSGLVWPTEHDSAIAMVRGLPDSFSRRPVVPFGGIRLRSTSRDSAPRWQPVKLGSGADWPSAYSDHNHAGGKSGKHDAPPDYEMGSLGLRGGIAVEGRSSQGGTMRLFQVLQVLDDELVPERCKLHMAVWNGHDDPLDVYLRGQFDDWQCQQGRRNFERDFVISLISMASLNRWLFVGAYDAVACERRTDGGYLYQLRKRELASELDGVLSFPSSARAGNDICTGRDGPTRLT